VTIIRTGKPLPDGQRRRDIELATDDLLTRLADAVRNALTERLDEVVLVLAGSDFRADAQNRGERSRLEQFAPMVIDPVLQAGIWSQRLLEIVRLQQDAQTRDGALLYYDIVIAPTPSARLGCADSALRFKPARWGRNGAYSEIRACCGAS